MIKPKLFGYSFKYAAKTDIGLQRSSNQDEIICCPEYGFFAVSDGMGGMRCGGETSAMIAKALPGLIGQAYEALTDDPRPERAAKLLDGQVRLLSDSIYKRTNRGGKADFGATLCGVWLVKDRAVFVNLGDSRGYWLGYYKKRIRQVTKDHNIAALLVESGELSREEARFHPSSSSLTRFVGMANPALPETFMEKLKPGDRILLCSDGLYGMTEEERLPIILRSSRSPERVVKRLVDYANGCVGRDNISAVYIKVL